MILAMQHVLTTCTTDLLGPDHYRVIRQLECLLEHRFCTLQVYRDDSRKGKNPLVKPAREFHLIWRQNGQSPVSMWEPLPPSGYRALGTVVVPAAEQPGSNEVLCVREDLCAKSGLFDSAIWKYEPTVMQVGNPSATVALTGCKPCMLGCPYAIGRMQATGSLQLVDIR